MIPSLAEPDLKRQWAEKHLKLLKLEIDHFCNNNRYRIEPEEDPDAGQYRIKLFAPSVFSAIHAVLTVSDFVMTLRAVLDYLVHQLVLQNDGTPGRLTCFPIYDLENSDNRRRIDKATHGMVADAVAAVKSFQPYHAGSDYKLTHLWRLATLSNIQKHRQISPFAVKPPWQFCLSGNRPAEIGEVFTHQIDNCTIVTFPLIAKDYVKFNPEGTGVELRFYEEAEGIDVGYEDFVEMYEFVKNDIIPAFARFFPEPGTSGQSAQNQITVAHVSLSGE